MTPRRIVILITSIATVGALTASLALAGLNAVSDGLNRFSASERPAAEDALFRASLACGNEPGERILRRKWRIVELETFPGRTAEKPGNHVTVPNYRAEVRSYTLFGIPTGTIEVRPSASISCL